MTSIRTAAVFLALAALACARVGASAEESRASARGTRSRTYSDPAGLAVSGAAGRTTARAGLDLALQLREPRRAAGMRVEETAVLTKTGQLIVLVNIRVASDTRTPVALVQLPLGLNLPAGAKLQVDDGKVDRPADPDLREPRLLCQRAGLAGASGRAEVRQAAQGRPSRIWTRKSSPSRCRWPISPRRMRRSSSVSSFEHVAA